MEYTKKVTKKSNFDILFYLKIVGIVIFSVFDVIVTAIISLYKNTSNYIKGRDFENYLKKYILFKRNKSDDCSASDIEDSLAFEEETSLDCLSKIRQSNLPKKEKKVLRQAFTLMKKSAEMPDNQRNYIRAIEKLLKKNNLTWDWFKKEYDTIITEEIISAAKPYKDKILKKNSIKTLILYYQEPTKINFIRLCNHAKNLSNESFRAFLDLLHRLDSRLWARVATELN